MQTMRCCPFLVCKLKQPNFKNPIHISFERDIAIEMRFLGIVGILFFLLFLVLVPMGCFSRKKNVAIRVLASKQVCCQSS